MARRRKSVSASTTRCDADAWSGTKGAMFEAGRLGSRMRSMILPIDIVCYY